MRSFGTEQFSLTVTLDEFADQEVVNKSIDLMNATVLKMLTDTEERSIKEREVLAKSAERRAMSLQVLEDALKKETEAKKSLGKEVDRATTNFNKLNKNKNA